MNPDRPYNFQDLRLERQIRSSSIVLIITPHLLKVLEINRRKIGNLEPGSRILPFKDFLSESLIEQMQRSMCDYGDVTQQQLKIITDNVTDYIEIEKLETLENLKPDIYSWYGSARILRSRNYPVWPVIEKVFGRQVDLNEANKQLNLLATEEARNFNPFLIKGIHPAGFMTLWERPRI